MKRFVFLQFAMLLAAFLAGCWAASDTASPGTPTPQAILPASDYTDANAALADGTRLLDSGDTVLAIELLNRAVELNPDLAEAYFRLGIAYSLVEFSDQLAAKSDDSNTQARDLPENNEDKPKREKPNSVIAFEKAVEAYRRLLKENDEDHLSYYNLGRAYSKLNEDEEAAKALRQAVKLNPDDTEYQTELGSILIRLAKYSEAVTALKKALQLDAENLEAEELLEKAEAGQKRINFATLPKDDKKTDTTGDEANTNTNEGTEQAGGSNTSGRDVISSDKLPPPKKAPPAFPSAKSTPKS